MNKSQSKGRVLITGASGGIGLELARCFARGRYELVLLARREDELNKVRDELQNRYKIDAQVLAADLSDAKSPKHIAQVLADTPIDILVNNAGFGDFGPFAQCDEEKMLGELAVNITSLTHLTRLFLPPMLERKRGRILNVASTASFLPGPLMSVYYASKAYVLSFSEAITNELVDSGVTVTCLCPGPTTTDFQERAEMKSSKLMDATMMDAATVARAGYRACVRGQAVVIPGHMNAIATFATRFMSRELKAKVVRRAQDSKTK